MARPSKVTVSLDALRHNYALAQSLAPDANSIAVVKADAYGHGACEVAKALEATAPAFGVACIEEAIQLREAGITKPILLLEGIFTQDEIAIAAENEFWLMLHTSEQIDMLLAANISSALKVWLKVDTGMHRLGITPDALTEIISKLTTSNNVEDEIILATHLSSAEMLDRETTKLQVQLFKDLTKHFDHPQSIANSSGIMGWPITHRQWSRPGLMLYGVSPFSGPHKVADKLRPVMTLSSEIIAIRDVAEGETVGYGGTWTAKRPSRIATIAIGYGDGYPLHAPAGTPVLIDGKRAPLAGRVSMDMITVDVTDIDNVTVGTEVILWGDELGVNEIAHCAGSSGYELLTRMTKRVPRRYNP